MKLSMPIPGLSVACSQGEHKKCVMGCTACRCHPWHAHSALPDEDEMFSISRSFAEHLWQVAFANGREEGVRAAAAELFAKLVRKGIRDDNWNGGDVVEVVDAWLQSKGIDTRVPEDEEE